MENTIKKIEESYDGSIEHPIITCEESHVQGFDPATKKGFTTCTKSYRYHVLVCFKLFTTYRKSALANTNILVSRLYLT